MIHCSVSNPGGRVFRPSSSISRFAILGRAMCRNGESVGHLGRLLSKTYGNKALITSMGPLQLAPAFGNTRDFYKHEVVPVLNQAWPT